MGKRYVVKISENDDHVLTFSCEVLDANAPLIKVRDDFGETLIINTGSRVFVSAKETK